MTESKTLERRYQRLLALYPKAFQRERGDEMLTVLMSGASDGQQWPRLDETTDLVRSAIPMQLQHVEYPSRLARKYPNQVIVTRIGVGIWLMVLTAIFCTLGYWWGLALLAPAALHFYLAYRIDRFATGERNKPGAGGPPAATAG
jgi:hypothetical protein